MGRANFAKFPPLPGSLSHSSLKALRYRNAVEVSSIGQRALLSQTSYCKSQMCINDADALSCDGKPRPRMYSRIVFRAILNPCVSP